jgi:hypothetical protein
MRGGPGDRDFIPALQNMLTAGHGGFYFPGQPVTDIGILQPLQ